MKAACISLLSLPSDLFLYSLAHALPLPLYLFLRFDYSLTISLTLALDLRSSYLKLSGDGITDV